MKITPIKRKFKNLSTDELITKKSQISSFLMDHPDTPNSEQGWVTTQVLYNLINCKKREDFFQENVIKELFFQ